MRSFGFGFALFVVGCTSSAPDKLPGVARTPHLENAPASVACGDDVAFYGNPSPDIRYGYTFDGQGRLSHASGAYAAGGADQSIDYAWNGWNMTHMLSTHGWNDATQWINATYDGDDLTTYTWDYSTADYHDNWTYAYTDFIGPWQPTRETITQQGGDNFGYTLAYDGDGRLVTATPDGGNAINYTYDDAARVITIDSGGGAYHGTVTYDDQFREINETWGGSDPHAWASEDLYTYSGDRLDTIVYSSGTEDAPQTLTLVETDTLRYNCAAARTQNGGTNVRLMNPRARRVH